MKSIENGISLTTKLVKIEQKIGAIVGFVQKWSTGFENFRTEDIIWNTQVTRDIPENQTRSPLLWCEQKSLHYCWSDFFNTEALPF